tara:strand:- start:724 stop:1413 length:690 start_codon:yes stop_codon:yes gene_type:complete
MKRVAIMQPTYLPWHGYFELISSVETFVFLDSVQFSKRSWQQRNLIKTPQGLAWLTVPVLSKGKRTQLIKDTLINKESNFITKHIKCIEKNYAKASFYESESKILFENMNSEYDNISDLNINLIMHISSRLNIKTNFIRSSSLDHIGTKSDLLASICSILGASEYISTPGSKIYLEESESFKNINLPIKYFEYSKPIYKQLWGDFLPNLSIIDMLFNCGDETNLLIKNS